MHSSQSTSRSWHNLAIGTLGGIVFAITTNRHFHSHPILQLRVVTRSRITFISGFG